MAEEDTSNVLSSNIEKEDDSAANDGHGFYLLSQDEIEEESNIPSSSREPQERTNPTESEVEIANTASTVTVPPSPVDVEAIKRKAEQIASSLQKFRNKVGKSTDEPHESTSYEPPEDLKRHRERSLFVAQKLKEDRILFEESKKRNEAVFDKVRSVKKIHQNIAENMKELIRDDNDDNSALKLRVERLESALSHLQETLAEKNRVISEKNETIRTLNQTVTETCDSYMHSLEQSKVEINELKAEYRTTVEEVTKSKEEVQNQLQVIRKKYLSLENDLKLSDFARCRLVSRNAELLESINQLESKNNDLVAKLEEKESLRSSSEDESKIILDEPSISLDDLRSKIESVVLITNEYQSLVEDESEIEELSLDDDGNGDDVLETIDKVGDKLESIFFTIRDKLSSLPKLQNETDKIKDKLKHLEKACKQSKTREAELQEQLAFVQKNLEEKSRANEELREKLASVQASNDDWSAKYYDVDKLNEQLQRQLNMMRDNEVVTSVDTSHQVEKLQNECLRLERELEMESKEREELQEEHAALQNRCTQLEVKLVEKMKECENLARQNSERKEVITDELENLRFEYNRVCQQYESLRDEYEQVRRASEHADDSNDKYENDFVVLQKRDCDEEENWKRNYVHLQQENEKLMESVRLMSQKAIEYENEKISLHCYVNECRHLQERVARLSTELEAANQLILASNEEKEVQEDSRDEEIEGLQAEMSKLVQQLSEVWDQLHDEKISNGNLKEQLRYSENVNAELSSEVKELRERCSELENLRRSNEELVAAMNELQERVKGLVAGRDELDIESHCKDVWMQQNRENRERHNERPQLVEYKGDETAGRGHELEVTEHHIKQLSTGLGNEALEHELKLQQQRVEELTIMSKENETLRQELITTQQRVEELMKTAVENEALRQELITAQQHVEELMKMAVENEALRQELTSTQQRVDELTRMAIENESLRQELRSTQQRVVELTKMVAENEELQSCQFELLSAKADADQKCQQLQTELNERQRCMKQTQDELQRKTLDLQNALERYTEIQTLLARTQLELQNTKDELEKLQNQQRSQYLVEEVIAKCNREIEGLQLSIQDLKRENGTLSERCKSYYTKYMALYQHVNEIIGRARSTSDDVVRIIHNLQNQWKPEEIDKVEAVTQYDESLAEEYVSEIYERGRQTEIQTYEKLLDEIRTELNGLQSRYAFVKEQLMCKDDECNAEIAAYENLLTQLRSQLAHAQDELSSRVAEIDQYKSVIAELQLQKIETVATDIGVQVTDSDLVQSPESPPTLARYFDYYKGKVAKGFSEILQPEEQPDYSNWILPEEQDTEYNVLAGNVDAAPPTLLDKESQVLLSNADATTQLSMDQPATSNQGSQATVMDRDSMTQTHDSVSSRMSISDVIERLRILILRKYDDDSNWGIEDEDSEWSSSELNINDEEFANTAMKFVTLFESVIRYYATYPETEAILSQYRSILSEMQLPDVVTKVEDYRETFEQVATLTTRLENENKYLLDAITFIEDVVASRTNADVVRFQTVIQSWRGQADTDETDIIDRICEEYDIVPAKFVPGELFANWKERIVKSFESSLSSTIAGDMVTTEGVLKIFERLKKKMHRLICDMHDAYKVEEKLNPVAFFEQIEDINHLVEVAVKLARSGEIKDDLIEIVEDTLPVQEVHPSHHVHDLPEHDYHEHEHEHQHQHLDHEHHHHEYEHDHRVEEHHDHREEQRDTSAELKLLLAESNKKIDKLVKELMDVKNSREYNEVRQLHNKLDETLYQLHLRDVHVMELTRELTQLLSERDSLQLKLSDIIRQNEHLRSVSVLNPSGATSVNVTDLENKLEELQKVNYMKDPRITEASKQYHATQMQLISDDENDPARRGKAENAGFSVPSLFKWFSGEPETK